MVCEMHVVHKHWLDLKMFSSKKKGKAKSQSMFSSTYAGLDFLSYKTQFFWLYMFRLYLNCFPQKFMNFVSANLEITSELDLWQNGIFGYMFWLSVQKFIVNLGRNAFRRLLEVPHNMKQRRLWGEILVFCSFTWVDLHYYWEPGFFFFGIVYVIFILSYLCFSLSGEEINLIVISGKPKNCAEGGPR